MLIPVERLIAEFEVLPDGVLHLGAHRAEEQADYRRWGWGHVYWVEANPELAAFLRTKLSRTKVDFVNTTVIEALVGEHEGVEATLNVASNGQSSSVLPFGTHATEHPEVTMTGQTFTLPVRTVDMLAQEHGIRANFMNLDLQGYELAALRGAVRFLQGVRWVYTEVNEDELYIGCPHINDITAYLERHGFTPKAVVWTKHGWGDALYERTSG